MKSIVRWLLSGVLVAGCLGLTACDDDCSTCHEETVIVDDGPCCAVYYPYLVEVQVYSRHGIPIPYADVELIVAMVPETRLWGMSDGYGSAFFQIEAPPDVAVVAYAEAPGHGGNASDIGTHADTDYLLITVFLDG